jgi:hypothetical protein
LHTFKGVFLLDSGPGKDHFEAADEYDIRLLFQAQINEWRD